MKTTNDLEILAAYQYDFYQNSPSFTSYLSPCRKYLLNLKRQEHFLTGSDQYEAICVHHIGKDDIVSDLFCTESLTEALYKIETHSLGGHGGELIVNMRKFTEMCAKHDWAYPLSDDHRAKQREKESLAKLEAIVRVKGGDFAAVFNAVVKRDEAEQTNA